MGSEMCIRDSFNRAHKYPILVAHDAPLGASVRRSLSRLCSIVPRFVLLHNRLPVDLPAEAVPAEVLGFSVEYRLMIRWKTGLMWLMPELQPYE